MKKELRELLDKMTGEEKEKFFDELDEELHDITYCELDKKVIQLEIEIEQLNENTFDLFREPFPYDCEHDFVMIKK